VGKLASALAKDGNQTQIELGDCARQTNFNFARHALYQMAAMWRFLDDATTMVQQQRDAAWGEVARSVCVMKLKNPLTPIQLSAERMAHKLSSKPNAADAEMFGRLITVTIVTKYSFKKTMVNEFMNTRGAPAV
jgi:nitrogen fixation/metabolism regulation signal transduction histidine kinase